MSLFLSENDALTVRPVRPDDAAALAAVYATVAITPENIREKLTEGPGSFGAAGGMFHPLTAEEIRTELKSPAETFLAAEADGQLGGVVWFSCWQPEMFERIAPAEGMAEAVALFCRERDRKNMGYFKDAIALDPKRKGIGCYCMVYDMCRRYLALGIGYSCWEVYHIDGWDDGTGFRPLDMMNRASNRFSTACGAVCLGDAPQKVMAVGGARVWITPRVYLLKAETAVENTSKIMKNKGWRAAEI